MRDDAYWSSLIIWPWNPFLDKKIANSEYETGLSRERPGPVLLCVHTLLDTFIKRQLFLYLLLYWKYQTEENGGILTRDELVATKSCGLLRQKSTWLTAPYSLTTIGNWKNNKDKTMFSILISPCKHRNALLTLSFLQYLVSLVWLLETLGNLRIPSRWNSAILQLPWEENQRLLAISQ